MEMKYNKGMKKRQVKIRTRLITGFTAMVMFVIVMGVVAFFQTRSLWQTTRDMYDHPYRVNIAIREIQIGINAMQVSIKNVILAKDALERERYVQQIIAAEQDVDSHFKVVYDQYLGSRLTVDSAYTAFAGWKAIRDTTIMLCNEGRISEASLWSTHRASEYKESMFSVINRLRAFAMNKADTYYATAQKSSEELRLQLILILGAVLIVTLFIATSIYRAVSRPLRKLANLTHQYGEGNYTVRSDLESTNEIGQLAISFNHMADSIVSELRIKSGISKLGESMLGTADLAEFSKSLVGAFLTHTDSEMGAFYLLDEEKDVFVPVFSIGLTNSKLISFSARHFEGEFGRTLLEKKIMHFRQIPEDTVFDFSTVAGTFKPREIVNLPVLINNRVVAIVSLGTLHSYSVEVIEMLHIAEKNISAGLGSVLAFQKVKAYSVTVELQNTELEMQSKELKMQSEELHEQNAELEMQKRQIEDANRLKSEFLSSMSHELRTPLNSVIALSGVLNRKLKGMVPDEEHSYLEIIERNAKHLLSLINEILDLSRIEAGKSDIQYNTVSLKELTQSILDSLQVQIKKKKLKVEDLIGADFPMIRTDQAKCHHILQNLIGNAVKFTESGKVEISARVMDNQAFLTVKDTGIGINKEDLPRIFEQFHQVDGSASKKHEGTGLGLAIADKYAKMLGGKIEVISTIGVGSEFTFIIPVPPSEMIDLKNLNEALQADASEHFQIHTDQGLSTPPNVKILIIEDSEPAIIQLSEILREEGYFFDVARSGLEAIEMVKYSVPDAIILDLMMPGMDGFEVLENIRGTEKTKSIPVVILTAKYLNKDELKRLTSNNIYQLIQKGDVGKGELLNHIQKMVRIKMVPEKILPKHAVPVVREGKATLLLVEDNEDNVKTIQVLLGDTYHVIVARDGAEGVKTAGTLKPDLILLDIFLPEKDGFLVLEEIRKIELLKQIPVIAITARAMKGDREQILRYGFDDYLSKPVSAELLTETLSKWILTLPGN